MRHQPDLPVRQGECVGAESRIPESGDDTGATVQECKDQGTVLVFLILRYRG